MKFIFSLFITCTTLVSCDQNPTVKENIPTSNVTTTYIFIRHTEKDTSDPDNKNPHLTEEGKKRAENWTKILADTPIDYIFSTNYHRTLETSAPIAQSNNIAISMYDTNHLYNTKFQEKTKGKTSLIVGHSNTTPSFINKILEKDKYHDIDSNDHGKLYLLKITGNTITETVLNIN